jgi:hypothetical protein
MCVGWAVLVNHLLLILARLVLQLHRTMGFWRPSDDRKGLAAELLATTEAGARILAVSALTAVTWGIWMDLCIYPSSVDMAPQARVEHFKTVALVMALAAGPVAVHSRAPSYFGNMIDPGHSGSYQLPHMAGRRSLRVAAARRAAEAQGQAQARQPS